MRDERAGGGRRARPAGWRRAGGVALVALALAPVAGAAAGADRAAERERMLGVIEHTVRETREATGVEALDARVAAALRAVPRHEFVPAAESALAYANRPLPIGHGQTISQPYLVALMTELLGPPARGARVLEVGTGSGYQAAVLAALGAEVYSIEIIEPLADAARERLRRLGYRDVRVRLGDGYDGWPEHAPFAGIVVTAAASHVPPPLLAQLAPGGRLVIPVGGRFEVQQLLLVTKDARGEASVRQVLPVRFVPLTGGH